MSPIEFVEFSAGRVELRPDGIVRVTLKGNREIMPQHAATAVRAMKGLLTAFPEYASEDDRAPVLLDHQRPYVLLFETQLVLAKMEVPSALALLSSGTIVNEAAAEHTLMVLQADYPAGVYVDEEKALDWLRRYAVVRDDETSGDQASDPTPSSVARR
jgi:hypothetical protein